MRLSFEDGLDQTGGVRTDTFGILLQTLMGPAGIAAMRARHVFADRGVPSLLPGSEMARDPTAAMEKFDRGRGDARRDLLLDQAVGNGIVVFVDLDMIIDPDPAFLPLGVFINLRRQDVTADPIRQLLAPGRLGVGITGRAEHGDEDLGRANLAGGRIEDLDGLSTNIFSPAIWRWRMTAEIRPRQAP